MCTTRFNNGTFLRKPDTNPLNILSREDSSLGELGGLRNQILLVLGIATLTTFVFIVAGTK